MQCKLFVALRLEVAHHFIERCAKERTRRLEPPLAFRTTKTPKMLVLNPYQLLVHGGRILQAANLDGLSGTLHKWKIPFRAEHCIISRVFEDR
jgi:hypothetical protein